MIVFFPETWPVGTSMLVQNFSRGFCVSKKVQPLRNAAEDKTHFATPLWEYLYSDNVHSQIIGFAPEEYKILRSALKLCHFTL